MATYPVTDAPNNLTMTYFLAQSGKYQGLVRACRFVAVIRPTGQFLTSLDTSVVGDLTYLCEATEMPGRGLMSADIRYYGPQFKLPFLTQYEDINMTFLCRTESFERQFFDDWMLVINPNDTWDFNYRDEYRSEIDIYQYGESASASGGGVTIQGFPGTTPPNATAPQAYYKFTLHNAFPILINPQPVTWADADQFQRLVVSFTYTHWSRQKGLDPEPRQSGYNNINLVAGRPNTRNF